MQLNEKISEKELTFIISNLIIVKMIFSFTRGLFLYAGNSAWIESVFMSLIALAFLELSFLTYRICGKKTVVEVAEEIGGKLLKSVVTILCLFVLFANFVSEIRIFFESVKIVLLPRTKTELIMLMVAIAIAIGAKKGMTAIATVNAIFFPICLIFLAFIAVFLIKNYDINNLFPMLGEGTQNIVFGGIKNMFCFSDILALNLLMPHIKDIGTVKRSGRKAVVIASVTLILICLCYALCYSDDRAKEFLLPIYQLTRMIKAGEYFQRFEAFFEFVWTITELLYAEIYVFLIAETVSRGFSVPNYKVLIYPTIAISFLLAIEEPSVVDVIKMSDLVGVTSYPIAFLLPIIIPILYIPKKRKGIKQ